MEIIVRQDAPIHVLVDVVHVLAVMGVLDVVENVVMGHVMIVHGRVVKTALEVVKEHV